MAKLGGIVIRSRNKIEELVSAIYNELSELPSHDVFGDSNAENIKEMHRWLAELHAILSLEGNATVIIFDEHSEAIDWLTNKSSYFASDFGVHGD